MINRFLTTVTKRKKSMPLKDQEKVLKMVQKYHSDSTGQRKCMRELKQLTNHLLKDNHRLKIESRALNAQIRSLQRTTKSLERVAENMHEIASESTPFSRAMDNQATCNGYGIGTYAMFIPLLSKFLLHLPSAKAFRTLTSPHTVPMINPHAELDRRIMKKIDHVQRQIDQLRDIMVKKRGIDLAIAKQLRSSPKPKKLNRRVSYNENSQPSPPAPTLTRRRSLSNTNAPHQHSHSRRNGESSSRKRWRKLKHVSMGIMRFRSGRKKSGTSPQSPTILPNINSPHGDAPVPHPPQQRRQFSQQRLELSVDDLLEKLFHIIDEEGEGYINVYKLLKFKRRVYAGTTVYDEEKETHAANVLMGNNDFLDLKKMKVAFLRSINPKRHQVVLQNLLELATSKYA